MLRQAFAKVADYHMNHRGHIGFGLGVIAAVLCARTGLDAMLVSLLAELLFGDDNPAVAQIGFLSSLTGVPSVAIIAGGVVIDAVIHQQRKNDNGPQPPAP